MTARCALTVAGARWSDRASQVVDLGTTRCSRIAARDRPIRLDSDGRLSRGRSQTRPDPRAAYEMTGWSVSNSTETHGQRNTDGTNHTPAPLASTAMSCSDMSTRIWASA